MDMQQLLGRSARQIQANDAHGCLARWDAAAAAAAIFFGFHVYSWKLNVPQGNRTGGPHGA